MARRGSRCEGDRASTLDEPELTRSFDGTPPSHEVAQRRPEDGVVVVVHRHRHCGNDPSIHLLELDEVVDTSAAVAVPTRAGGVTFHHPRTLHFSRPNTTDADRRAYANEFQTTPVPRQVPRDHPWYRAGTEAYQASKVGDS